MSETSEIDIERPVRSAALQQMTVTVTVELEERMSLAAHQRGELPTVLWREAAEQVTGMIDDVTEDEVAAMAEAFVRGSRTRDRLDGETTKVSFRVSGETADQLDEISDLTLRTVSSLIRQAATELAVELLPDDQLDAAHRAALESFEQRIRIFQGTD